MSRLDWNEVIEKYGEDYSLWKSSPQELCMEVSKPEGQIKHFPILSLFEQAKKFWSETLPSLSVMQVKCPLKSGRPFLNSY